jgi:LacI family transcriptional regulator
LCAFGLRSILRASIAASVRTGLESFKYVEKKARFVDGLLFATNHHDADGALAAAISGVGRVVLVDEDVPEAQVSKIFADNIQGGYLAGRYLVEAGHQRLAYIAGPRDLMSTKERGNGFREAVLTAGATIVEEVYGGYTVEHGAQAIAHILASAPVSQPYSLAATPSSSASSAFSPTAGFSR